MKAHLVLSVAVTIVLLTTSYADPPQTGGNLTRVASEFEVKNGKWKPAGPKPVVPNIPLTRAQRKAQRTPWTWERLAMQPIRLIVMAAKVPLIPAGFLATAVIVGDNRAHGGDMEFPDFGQALESFDPGPAIDADLERMHPRTMPKDERAPTPFKSDLRVTRATPPSSGRPPTSMNIAYNRPAKAPAIPAVPSNARSLVAAAAQEISPADPIFKNFDPGTAVEADLLLISPFVASKYKHAAALPGPDLSIANATAPQLGMPLPSVTSPSVADE